MPSLFPRSLTERGVKAGYGYRTLTEAQHSTAKAQAIVCLGLKRHLGGLKTPIAEMA